MWFCYWEYKEKNWTKKFVKEDVYHSIAYTGDET